MVKNKTAESGQLITGTHARTSVIKILSAALCRITRTDIILTQYLITSSAVNWSPININTRAILARSRHNRSDDRLIWSSTDLVISRATDIGATCSAA
jgi:hypothetical protein